MEIKIKNNEKSLKKGTHLHACQVSRFCLGEGVEGYIFMEKSPGFEIGKLGNYASSMKQQQCYIKKQENPTKPKGKTNKRLKTCPIYNPQRSRCASN